MDFEIRPAPLAFRFLALWLDCLVLKLAFLLASIAVFAIPAEALSGAKLGEAVLDFLGVPFYFAFCESIWGTTLGKAAFGLRVVRSSGGSLTFLRALGRASSFVAAVLILDTIAAFGAGCIFTLLPESPVNEETSAFVGAVAGVIAPSLILAGASGRNGYAGLHDRLTSTRVIQRKRRTLQRRSVTVTLSPPMLESSHRIGPYAVIERIGTHSGGELLLGYDPLLRRKVWIRQELPGVPTFNTSTADACRSGRLRRVNGNCSDSEKWHAYEVPTGRPLVELLQESCPWSTVRFWLLDLGVELVAAEKDRTLPPALSFDYVWITSDNRAKLLEFPFPLKASATGISTAPPIIATTHEAGRMFFGEVAHAACAANQASRLADPNSGKNSPWPLHARRFLETLAQPLAFDEVVRQLRTLLAERCELGLSLRLRGLLASTCVPALLIVIGLFTEAFFSPWNPRRWFAETLEFTSWFWLFGWIVPSLVLNLLIRGGIALKRTELAVVTQQGQPASHLRVFWRALLAWLPGLACALPIVISGRSEEHVAWQAPLLAAYAIVALFSASSARSVQDRASGTWLVPL